MRICDIIKSWFCKDKTEKEDNFYERKYGNYDNDICISIGLFRKDDIFKTYKEADYPDYHRVQTAGKTDWRYTVKGIENNYPLTFQQCNKGYFYVTHLRAFTRKGLHSEYIKLTRPLLIERGITPEFAVGACEITYEALNEDLNESSD